MREIDCDSNRGIWIEKVHADPDSIASSRPLLGRCLAEDVTLETAP